MGNFIRKQAVTLVDVAAAGTFMVLIIMNIYRFMLSPETPPLSERAETFLRTDKGISDPICLKDLDDAEHWANPQGHWSAQLVCFSSERVYTIMFTKPPTTSHEKELFYTPSL